MVGNKLEQEIIGLYNEDITALYSINEIAKKLDKAYPYINKKVNSLIKSKILKKTEIGRSYLCTVNLENDEAVWLLVLNEIQARKKVIRKEKKITRVLDFIHEARQAIPIHLALKTNNHLVFVVETEEDKKILRKSKTLKEYKTEAHTKAEFLELLLKDKTILQDHSILHGYEKYYQYIREVKGALRIKHSPLLQ